MSIIAAADGSALGNPGPAGWAWYIDESTWRAGGWEHGTNNMGELKAVLDLLEATGADRDQHLEVLCDSQYVINAITRWMPGWKRKGWRKKDGKPVLNLELLQAIDRQLEGRSVEFTWVKGHAGHTMNEAADARARAAATAFSRGQDPDIGPGYRASHPGAGMSAAARCSTDGLDDPHSSLGTDAPSEQDLFSLLETSDADDTAPAEQGRNLEDATTSEQQVIASELALLSDRLREDPPSAAALLHPDFTEISASGRLLSREETLERITPIDGGYEAEELIAEQIIDGVILLRFETVSAHGRARCSALWVRSGDRWLLRHHQGTPVPEER